MTLQETFDFVARALAAQGRPSIEDGLCVYRGPGGLKCAAGHLIPDDRYSRGMENLPAQHPSIAGMLAELGHSTGLVSALQAAHDEAPRYDSREKWLKAWRPYMLRVANAFGLKPDALDDAVEAALSGGAKS